MDNKNLKNNNNNIINNLIRASLGSEAKSVDDHLLDDYVSQLIAKEAAEKRKKHQSLGLLSTDSPPTKINLRPNTSYLRNVLKQTHSHNNSKSACTSPSKPSHRGNASSDHPTSQPRPIDIHIPKPTQKLKRRK